MSISTDLKAIFPKYNHGYHRDCVTIAETDPQAKVKSLTWTNSDFHFVDTKMVKDMTSFFRSSNSSNIFNWDCDGIVLFENEGRKYFFLLELKSSFDSTDLYHAMDQIISSYIKTNMILHLTINYRNDDYIFEGFIACYPPKEDYKMQLRRKLQLPVTSKYKTDAEFAAELYFNKKCEIKATECEKIRGIKLGNNCLFNNLRFNLIEVPRDQNSINVDVIPYL